MNKKFKVGLIRVLTTEDEEVLQSHGKQIMEYFPELGLGVVTWEPILFFPSQKARRYSWNLAVTQPDGMVQRLRWRLPSLPSNEILSGCGYDYCKLCR